MKNLISFMFFGVYCNFLNAPLINSPIENALTQELNADTTQQVTKRQVYDCGNAK